MNKGKVFSIVVIGLLVCLVVSLAKITTLNSFVDLYVEITDDLKTERDSLALVVDSLSSLPVQVDTVIVEVLVPVKEERRVIELFCEGWKEEIGLVDVGNLRSYINQGLMCEFGIEWWDQLRESRLD